MAGIDDSQGLFGLDDGVDDQAKRRRLADSLGELQRSIENGTLRSLEGVVAEFGRSISAVQAHTAAATKSVTDAMVTKLLPKSLDKKVMKHVNSETENLRSRLDAFNSLAEKHLDISADVTTMQAGKWPVRMKKFNLVPFYPEYETERLDGDMASFACDLNGLKVAEAKEKMHKEYQLWLKRVDLKVIAKQLENAREKITE